MSAEQLPAPGRSGQNPSPGAPSRGLVAVVGVLVGVELASGVLQGFYSPIWTDIAARLGIATADVNWFEASQLIFSALTVPLLARLGDAIGHRQVLLIATAATAAGSWVLAFAPSFPLFLAGFALQGAYVVWLPVEVAIIHRRTAGSPDQHQLTRRAAGILVGALEIAVIAAALTAGALVDSAPLTLVLAIPALAVTVCFVVVWIGIERTPGRPGTGFDGVGLALLVVVLGLVMAGFVVIRLAGPASPLPWALIVLGLVAIWPFTRYERGRQEPLIDVRLLVSRAQWPLQATAFLIGMSVLGAQIPLSTYVRAQPAAAGYGLGLSASFVSILTGIYVIFLAVGAFTLPAVARRIGDRESLVGSCVVVAIGYATFLPFHSTAVEVTVAMALAGIGTGGIIASLPAAAAAAAPPDRTGFATGMTNTTKTVGGAVASSVFAIALADVGSVADPRAGAASLAGYLTVWSVCAGAALLAAAALTFLPRAGAAAPAPPGS
ncbi:MFS transporter [Frondihabitans australicus]|uniref:MFS transporter n=1 Tax=Frondihabitans australicus TaxID=386892 RepID=A0A495IF06_9MICO|nr:MFS transporter [Frondihabitans australicus]RKR73606.1 MFS transporter [Frondihabitans australicus]